RSSRTACATSMRIAACSSGTRPASTRPSSNAPPPAERPIMLAPAPEQLATEIDAALGHSGLGWQAFTDLERIAQMLVVLLVAVLLAATIAYHPSTRAKATTLEQINQPKTFMMYSM